MKHITRIKIIEQTRELSEWNCHYTTGKTLTLISSRHRLQHYTDVFCLTELTVYTAKKTYAVHDSKPIFHHWQFSWYQWSVVSATIINNRHGH